MLMLQFLHLDFLIKENQCGLSIWKRQSIFVCVWVIVTRITKFSLFSVLQDNPHLLESHHKWNKEWASLSRVLSCLSHCKNGLRTNYLHIALPLVTMWQKPVTQWAKIKTLSNVNRDLKSRITKAENGVAHWRA